MNSYWWMTFTQTSETADLKPEISTFYNVPLTP